MKITEIHARGLTTTFFNKMVDHIGGDVLFDLREKQKFQSTRASWARFILGVNHSIRNCSIASYEGGSKRKPYFSFCGLEVNKKREFNSWQERCLSGSSVFFTFDQETDSADALFNIGEHAIARVFERAKINITNELGEIDVFRILPAFHSIPLWTAFWSIVWGLARHHYKTQLPFRPIIPTQFGVFLGEVRPYATESSRVEIRTFVENESLSFVQNKTREVLLKAG